MRMKMKTKQPRTRRVLDECEPTLDIYISFVFILTIDYMCKSLVQEFDGIVTVI